LRQKTRREPVHGGSRAASLPRDGLRSQKPRPETTRYCRLTAYSTVTTAFTSFSTVDVS
jgi:hypothetical protein